MKRLYMLCTLLIIVLAGCQSESFSLNEDITQIEVVKLAGISPTVDEYEKGEGELINKITNRNEIEAIIKEIEDSEVGSLANSDISLPVYKVRFFQNEMLILTLGYYPATEDREQTSLIDLEKDVLYTTKSPLTLEKEQ